MTAEGRWHRLTGIRGRALLAALALGLCACSGGAAHVPAPEAAVGQQHDVPLAAAVAQAPLRDPSGHRVTLAALRGKIVVLSDMLTLCQETCPLDTANVVAAAHKVDAAGLGNRVRFLSVTVDPQRDTPARLAAFRRLYGAAPQNWLTLTGSPATLAALWKRLGVFRMRVPDTPPLPRDWLTGAPLHYDVTHSDQVFFIDADGHERFLLEGSPHVAAGAPIPRPLKDFLSAPGHRNLTHPDPQAWTLSQELQVISWLLDRRI